VRAVPRGEEVATLAIDGYGESAHSDLVVLPAGVPFQALEDCVRVESAPFWQRDQGTRGTQSLAQGRSDEVDARLSRLQSPQQGSVGARWRHTGHLRKRTVMCTVCTGLGHRKGSRRHRLPGTATGERGRRKPHHKTLTFPHVDQMLLEVRVVYSIEYCDD